MSVAGKNNKRRTRVITPDVRTGAHNLGPTKYELVINLKTAKACSRNAG